MVARTHTYHTLLSLVCTMAPHARQGHIGAAVAIGVVYYWGQGVAINYERSVAAYKVGAEAGNARCQAQVGSRYYKGRGVAKDFKLARAWYEKAAAQDDPYAICDLGGMYFNGHGVTPSWRRARELFKRAIELGNSMAVEHMQTTTESIAAVRVTRSGRPPYTSPIQST